MIQERDLGCSGRRRWWCCDVFDCFDLAALAQPHLTSFVCLIEDGFIAE
jgi:hypothetical protein